MIENEKDFDYFKYILRKQENMSIEPEETLRIQADMSRPFEAKNQLEAEALAYAKAAVPDQDPDTLYKVGMEHLSKADNSQARIFFELAADKNHAESMYRLGRCYLDGIGTDEDREKGIKLLDKAAYLGSADAMAEMARCNLYGIGMEKNPKIAVELLRQANLKKPGAFLNEELQARHALHESLRNTLALAKSYLNGDGVEKDTKKAKDLLQQVIILCDFDSDLASYNNEATALLDAEEKREAEERKQEKATIKEAEKLAEADAPYNKSRLITYELLGIACAVGVCAVAWFYKGIGAGAQRNMTIHVSGVILGLCTLLSIAGLAVLNSVALASVTISAADSVGPGLIAGFIGGLAIAFLLERPETLHGVYIANAAICAFMILRIVMKKLRRREH